MPAAMANLSALRRIGRSADPHFDRRVALVLAGSVAAGLAELLSIGAVAPLIAAALGGGSLPAWLPAWSVTGWALAFAVLVATTAAIRMALSVFTQRQVLDIAHRVAVSVHARVLAQPYSWHVRQHSSALVAALRQVDQLVYAVGWPLMQAMVAGIVGFAVLCLLAGTSWSATAIAVGILGLLYIGLSRYFARALARHGESANRHYERQVRILQESSGAIRDLLVEGGQEAFVDAFARSSEAVLAARRGTDFLGNAPRFLIEAIGAIALAAIVVGASGQPSGIAAILPTLALFTLAFVRLLPMAHQLFRGWVGLRSEGNVIEAVGALLRLPIDTRSAVAPLSMSSAIDVKEVDFAYADGTTVLRGASLHVAKGEWIGLTGASGGGKSTLGDLLIGLLSPQDGTIRVDNTVLAPANLTAWQQRVAPVSQSVFLVDGSVRENVAFATGVRTDDPRIEAAANLAELGDLLDRPMDDDGVGERGVRLSGGQRQRIGIARALVKDADLLLLDEATNALDGATESAILASIRRARPELTVIIISHRDAALAACDRVYRVDDGRVTAL